MPAGIMVSTTTGDLVDITGSTSARMRHVVHATSVSGQVTVSNWNSPNGDLFIVNNDDKISLPAVTWSNSTKVLKWWNHTPFNDAAFSDNFYIFLLDT